MEFEFWPAVVAGFTGGLVMTIMMQMAKSAGMTEMDMALIQGSMFTGDRGKAKAIGMFTHLVMMSGLVFGSLYAWLFSVLDVSSTQAWWVGAVFGVVHGIMAGFAFVMMPAMHPRMGPAPEPPVPGVHMPSPGLFGKNMGAMTPAGELMAHLFYGLVVGLVYAALV